MKIEISKIKPDETNQRSTGKDISELAESIKQFGLLQPIGVTKPDSNGIHTIVYGHRRFEACQLLEVDLIDVNILENLNLYDDFKAVQLTENIQRSDIHPMDEARTISKLLLKGKTQQDVALLLGKSLSYVRKRKALNDLIEPIQEAFIRGNIDLKMAHLLSGLHKDVQTEIYNDDVDDFTQEGEKFTNEWAVERELNKLLFYNFDKTECQKCPFNSAVNELFPTEDGAMCGNPSCLNKKKIEHQLSLLEQAKNEVAYFIYDGWGKPSDEKQAIGDKLTEEGYTVLWSQRLYNQVQQPDADNYTDGEADPEYIDDLKTFKSSFRAFDFNGFEFTDIVLKDIEDISEPSNVGSKEVSPEDQREKIEKLISMAESNYERETRQAKESYLRQVDSAIEDLSEETRLSILKEANPEVYLELEGDYLGNIEKLQKSHEIKIAELRSKL